ncbi:Hypothetical protein CINCED_3A006995 [Cinara cedri]|uniref:Uncharacterized protein n=1 Tax=Cinara cedri TaxID=506608 RepID=A0A5E4NMD4_9HEMI|nr:Hypothetical protein CINCED_3A006995 [Cinara cedri]
MSGRKVGFNEANQISEADLSHLPFEIDRDFPINFCTELVDNLLPSLIRRGVIRVSKIKPDCTDGELINLPQYKFMAVNVFDPNWVPGELLLIRYLRTPEEQITKTKPTNNKLATD